MPDKKKKSDKKVVDAEAIKKFHEKVKGKKTKIKKAFNTLKGIK